MAETEQLLVSLEARVDQFEKSMRRASQSARTNWSDIEAYSQKGAKKLESTFAQATQGVSNQFKLMATTAVGALTAAFGAAQLKSIIDSWSNLRNQIASAGVATQDISAKMQTLAGIATRTYSSIEAIGGAYQSIKRSQDELGASEAQVLRVTENLSKALALGGQGAEQAKAALLQTAQALASGTLQGDELRSILENAPELAQIIAGQMGVAVGKLKELGSEGRITSRDLFEAILNATDRLNAKWATLTPTISQSMQILQVEFTKWVGQLDEASGASSALASGISAVASNMSVVAPLAATFAAALAGFATGGPIVAGITGATVALAGFSNQIHPIASELASLGDYARVAFDLIKNQGAEAAAYFQRSFVMVAQRVSQALNSIDVGDALSNLLSAVRTVANLTIGAFKAAGIAIVAAWEATGVGISNAIIGALNSVIAATEAAANKVAQAVNSITSRVNAGVGTSFPQIQPVELGRLTGASRTAGEAVAKAYNDGLAAMRRDYIGDIEGALGRLRDSANKAAIERTFGQKSSDPGRDDGDINQALKASPAAKAGGGKGRSKAKGRAGADSDENAFSREIQNVEKRIRALNQEQEAIWKEAAEVEKAKIAFELLESAKAGNVTVTKELEGKVNQLADAYATAKVKLDEAKANQEQMKEASREVASTLSEGFRAAVVNGDRLSEVLERLWKRLSDKMIDKAFDNIISGIFNTVDKKQGGGGNLLGVIGEILGGIFEGLFQKKATGGLIYGPGSGTSDSIPTLLSAGEFVVRADQTAKFLPLLAQINAGTLAVLKFANGGLVAQPTIQPLAATSAPQPASSAPAQVAPQIVVNNHAAGIRVEPTVTEGQVQLMIYSAIKSNNARMPNILSGQDKRAA